MATKIKLRRGTAAEWTSANPTLEAGEAGVETDTRKIKIGNGSTAWNSLAYAVESLPTQTNNTGKVLSTNGTSASWIDPPSDRNLIINGAMQVSQRGTSITGIAANGYYTADRWTLAYSGLGAWTQSIEADGPAGSGLTKSLKMLCTTADSSPAAGDLLRVETFLEGQDLQRIKKGTASAEQLTLSFWVKSNVTGTYVAFIYDEDNNRVCAKSYSISESAIWEKKSLTFPADTIGTLNNDNGRSLFVSFGLGAGSNNTSGTLQTTWGTYQAANSLAGQTNLASATNNYWQITGVQLEAGPVATPFEFEPYEKTLRKCQRYYYLHAGYSASDAVSTGFIYSTGTYIMSYLQFAVTMRTAPTLNFTSGTSYYQLYNAGSLINFSGTSWFIQSPSRNAVWLFANNETGLPTAGNSVVIRTNNSNAIIAFSAEL